MDRGFRPRQLQLSGTYQCNLVCPHCCVPIEWTDRLDIDVAMRFVEDARREGIRTLGFTGGEPFVFPEFVVAVTRRAARSAIAKCTGKVRRTPCRSSVTSVWP